MRSSWLAEVAQAPAPPALRGGVRLSSSSEKKPDLEQLASVGGGLRFIKAYTESLTCLYTLVEDLDSKLTSCDVIGKKELIDVPGVVLGELLRWVRG